MEDMNLPTDADEIIKIVKKGIKDLYSPQAIKRRTREREVKEEKIAEICRTAVPKISVADDGTTDVLRDTKWVYHNMNRLFVTSRAGVVSLDSDVLAEAPSNGAVGLANYALYDKQKFFERFVIKILPKDDANEQQQDTEKDMIEKYDPSFEGLEKYLQKVEELQK